MDEQNMEALKQELQELEDMSEEEACLYYNVDTKEEAEQYIIDYWT